MKAYRVWLLLGIFTACHPIQVSMPQEVLERLPQDGLKFQTYVQPYDEQSPLPEAVVPLTVADIEKLGSQYIFAELEHRITAGQSLTTPIELYLADRASLLTLMQIVQEPNLALDQDPQAIARLIIAAEALVVDKSRLVPALNQLSNNILCTVYQAFEQHSFPLVSAMLEKILQPRLPYELSGTIDNPDAVWSVTLNAASNRIISGSDDRTIKIWDLVDGTWQPTQTLGQVNNTNTNLGHTGAVWSVSLNAAGNRIVSGSGDRTIKIWDLVDGTWQPTQTFGQVNNTGHTGAVWSVALNAAGNRIVSGSYDRTIKIWDLVDGTWQPTQTLGQVNNTDTNLGHTGSIWSVALNAGSRIVSGSDDCTIKIWDLVDGTWQPTQTLGQVNNTDTNLGHTSVVRSVALNAAGSRIVSGSYDRTIKIWDVEPINDFCQHGTSERQSNYTQQERQIHYNYFHY